jgi:hypothetical protein
MQRTLGMFTTYGIEYVFEYLGEERINSKIAELKNKPTMGIRLEEFAYGNAGYFSQKGILNIFTLLLDWFNDISFAIFLYESSKRYNELNYHDTGLLPIKWREHLRLIEWMNEQKRTTKAQYLNYTINPFWIDYHFFYFYLFNIVKILIKEKQSFQRNIAGQYNVEKNKLIAEITLEIKTRRKPLTGQYLLYRNFSEWYDLQKTESNEFEDKYIFKKDSDSYNLVLNKKENKATIEVIEIDKVKEIYKRCVLMINEDEIMQKLISDYVSNVEKISTRYKIEQAAICYSELALNACLLDIADYYSSKNNIQKANEIVDLNNKYSEVWKLIENYDESDYVNQ